MNETTATSKYHKMMVRTGVAFACMGLASSVILSDHIAIVISVAVCQTLVFSELLNVRQTVKELAAEEKHIPYFRTLNWFGYFISLFYVYGKDIARFYNWEVLLRFHFYLVFSMYCLFFMGFVMQLSLVAASAGKETKKVDLYKYQFMQLSWTLLIIFLVVFQLTFVAQHILEGVIWFFLPCSLVIMNDTAAYFCGFTMGNRFLKWGPLTALSPNKTWEGFLGASVLTVIWGWFVADFLSGWPWFICPRREYEMDANTCIPGAVFQHQTYMLGSYPITARPIQLHVVPLALFASFIAPFGGFLASGIKRAYNIKDFGSIIPGHGGFTDRMDCQFIMLFCTHVHYRTFIRVLPVTVAALTKTINELTGEEQIELLKNLQETVGAGS